MTYLRQRNYDLEEGRQEGRIEGRNEKAIEDAINLLKLNKLSEKEIAQTIGLPQEEVLKLKEKVTVLV